LLGDLLRDLKKRTEVQTARAEALLSLVTVNGETPTIVHQLCTAIGLALDKHAEGMRALSGFVDIIAENGAVQS